ncbi:hypothetical protein [Halalkalicoccus subterraneus]|uniref:hypothetical protein n=1 Tax=Halalkalicoccus subterraneus TaxID=2675002 RepID=UPI000EFD75C4|nr:hypothetical protein [Halalkalicoccus subterraneus]
MGEVGAQLPIHHDLIREYLVGQDMADGHAINTRLPPLMYNPATITSTAFAKNPSALFFDRLHRSMYPTFALSADYGFFGIERRIEVDLVENIHGNESKKTRRLERRLD